jgi:hypothetical protein
MLTQEQLGAAAVQGRRDQQQMDALWDGPVGKAFFLACLVMVGTSYCTQKTTTQVAQRAKAAAATSKAKSAAKAQTSSIARK